MKSWTLACGLGMLAVAAIANTASAVPIPIQNPGFNAFLAGTSTPMPDERFIDPRFGQNPTASSSGTNKKTINALNFQPAELMDIPGNWVSFGQKPNNIESTNAIGRTDGQYQLPTGSFVNINSNRLGDGTPGSGAGSMTQTLTGVSLQPNTLYTSTIEVFDFNPVNRPPFFLTTDDVLPADRNLIKIALLVNGVDVTDPSIGLSATLEFTNITPGGFGTEDQDPNTPSGMFAISGGKELLTYTLLTGATVPAGDLGIRFSAEGALEGPVPNGEESHFSHQTGFDNITLDASPVSAGDDADFDGDGDVDGADFLIFQRGVGTGTMQSQGDANFSGGVDNADLVIFKDEFGTPQAAAIPEPATSVLGAIAILGGWATMRRRAR